MCVWHKLELNLGSAAALRAFLKGVVHSDIFCSAMDHYYG